MEVDRAVAVDEALGVPGRARGVAHPGGVALVEDGPLGHRRPEPEQVLVAERAGGQRRVGGVRDDHELADRGQLLPHRLAVLVIGNVRKRQRGEAALTPPAPRLMVMAP
jgi:hypothetical protein